MANQNKSKRRQSIETIERFVKDVTMSQAEAIRSRRLSLGILNCILSRSTDTETLIPVKGRLISGKIPSWLRGSLYRVGPGVIQMGHHCYSHPFEMLSVVQKYFIGEEADEYFGRYPIFMYQNKILETQTKSSAEVCFEASDNKRPKDDSIEEVSENEGEVDVIADENGDEAQQVVSFSTVAALGQETFNISTAISSTNAIIETQRLKTIDQSNENEDSPSRSMKRDINVTPLKDIDLSQLSDSRRNSLLAKLEKSGSSNMLTSAGRRLSQMILGNSNSTLDNRCVHLDNCNDNLVVVGDDVFVVSDIVRSIRLQTDDLSTLEKFDSYENLNLSMMSSHPLLDTKDNSLWNVGISQNETSRQFSYAIVKFEQHDCQDVSGTRILENGRVIRQIPCRSRPCYFHSFGMSTNYVIFVEQPLSFETDRIGLENIFVSSSNNQNNFGVTKNGSIVKWRKGQKVNIYVVRKLDGSILPSIFVCDPFFFFHTINAFENDDYITLQLMAYKDSEIINDLKFSKIERVNDVSRASPISIKLPLKSNSTQKTVEVRSNTKVEKVGMELPTINPSFIGKANKYFYATGSNFLHPNKIYKVESESGDMTQWQELAHYVSEPIFIANPESDTEDDGILLVTMLSGSKMSKTELVIICAKSMTEMGRVEFQATGTVCLGMHGIFIPQT